MNEEEYKYLEVYLKKAYNEMGENLEAIHKKAISGSFINENSNNTKEKALYRFISKNFSLVKSYFRNIGFELISEGDNAFFYFCSIHENDNANETTLNSYIKVLDYLPFLLTADVGFSTIKNHQFRASDLEQAINNNVELKDLMGKTKKTNREYIDQLIRDFKNAGYIEEINTKEGRYLVLNSINYIITLSKYISIEDEEN